MTVKCTFHDKYIHGNHTI